MKKQLQTFWAAHRHLSQFSVWITTYPQFVRAAQQQMEHLYSKKRLSLSREVVLQ